MGLEVTTTIAGLDSTWPLVGDEVSKGDDHLRLLKATLKATFPGAGGVGFSIPITATEAEINYLSGVTSAIQTQLAARLALAGGTMTGPINEAEGAAIASAATVDLNAATGNFLHITGTTAITAVTLAQGAERTVVFDDALTLTNSASLLVVGGANITTAAGDIAVFRGEGAGVTRNVGYIKASGTAVTSLEVAKVWAYVTIAAGTPSISASHNVTSITDNGVGDYTVNYTTPFSSANNAPICSCRNGNSAGSSKIQPTVIAAGSVRLGAVYDNSGSWDALDVTNFMLSVFGVQ